MQGNDTSHYHNILYMLILKDIAVQTMIDLLKKHCYLTIPSLIRMNDECFKILVKL